MKDLSPLAQQLVKAGRNAGAPTDTDKQRIREALEQRLAAPPDPEPPADPSGSTLPAAPAAPWALIAGATLVAGVFAGALYWGFGSDSGALAPASSVAPVPLAPPAAPAHAENSPARAPAPVAPQVVNDQPALTPSTKKSSDTRPKNHLAEEVALLSRATSALHAGRAQEALSALAEHQQKFPRGLLSVERVAARAQALCQLGRKAEAERELARLSPTSPQAARARRACGSD